MLSCLLSLYLQLLGISMLFREHLKLKLYPIEIEFVSDINKFTAYYIVIFLSTCEALLLLFFLNPRFFGLYIHKIMTSNGENMFLPFPNLC